VEAEQPSVITVRVDLWRLAFVYTTAILAPLLVGLVAEFFFDTDFSLILLVAFVSLPLVIFWVCRTALAEMERVVQIVAPAEDPAATE
jgi:hypothetical protein